MNDAITFYDRTGKASLYLFKRQTLYAFEGQPLGYVTGAGDIYAFTGQWLGWMQEGWIRDKSGFCLCFQQDSAGGADQPRRGVRPPFCGREPLPAPAPPEPAPEHPQKIASWSEQTVTTFFRPPPLSLVQAVAFASATQRIYITNAYCAPSDSQTEALIEAVKRGVDVRLLLPGPHNDQPLTKAAGRHAYGHLLKGGVKIYEYQPTMIHSKTMVVDGLFSVFGSSNFDARSIEINEELDITVYDQKFGQEMESIFRQDLLQAKPYTLADFKKRSWTERLSEWLVLPFHSQM